MKFFLLAIIFLQSSFSISQAFAQEVDNSSKRKREVPMLILSNKKNAKQGVSVKESVPTVSNKVDHAVKSDEKITIHPDQYKDITRIKQDWKLQSKNLTNDINNLEKEIDDAKDATTKELHTKRLHELKFYRSIVNSHLKNYGRAITEARAVVKFDESYLLTTPSAYFNKNLTFDDTMSAAWYLLRTAEAYSCKKASQCLADVANRYDGKWYEGVRDTNNDASLFFNNSSFADFKTVIQSFLGKSACVGRCLLGKNLDNYESTTGEVDETVCTVYKDANKYSMYSVQIIMMNDKVLKYAATEKVKAYLCRGFTNVMMLESGINTNASYIANAKNDIKSAIALNTSLPVTQQIDEIDGIIDIDALFQKYGEIATKGMTNDDKALAQYAISEKGLSELKTSLEANSSDIEHAMGVSEYLTDKQKADIAVAYGKNTVVDPYGDPKVQTASIMSKDNRATIQQGLDAEANLQDLLDAIIDLQKNGDL